MAVEALNKLAAVLVPLAGLRKALDLMPTQYGSSIVTKQVEAYKAIAAEAEAALDHFAGEVKADPDAVRFVLFHDGTADLFGTVDDLAEAIGAKWGYVNPGLTVRDWTATAKRGDIGSFLFDGDRKGGFNVMVVADSWVAHL